MTPENKTAPAGDQGLKQDAANSYINSVPCYAASVNEAIAERAAIMAIEGVRYPDEKSQLCHFAHHGFKFIPKLISGKTMGSWPADCRGIDDALYWYDQGYHLLYGMNPAYVVFDLDTKDGKDGVRQFEKICPIWNIDAGEFPAFTVTASGGYHLFYMSEGVVYVGNCGDKNLGPDIDIRCQTVPIAVPGSYKTGKPYRFYGDLANAPLLPPVLRQRLKIHAKSPACTKPPAPPPRPAKAHKRHASGLDGMADWLDRNGPTGMNLRLFELKSWAKKEGYSGTEVNQLVQSRYGLDPTNPAVSWPLREAR